MRPEIFQALVRWRLDKLTDILVTKGAEYATNGDRLHNFNSSARIDNVSKAQALHGFMLKHYTNYRDMLDKFNRDEEIPVYQIRERFGDLLAYFLIQEVIFMEKYDAAGIAIESGVIGPDKRATFMEPALGAPYEPIDWTTFVKEHMEKISEALGVPVEELTKPIPREYRIPHIDPIKADGVTPLQYVINIIDEHIDVAKDKEAKDRLNMVLTAAHAMLDEDAALSKAAKPVERDAKVKLQLVLENVERELSEITNIHSLSYKRLSRIKSFIKSEIEVC